MNKTNKVLVIGNFNFGTESFNGQTRKTRDYFHYLKEEFGEDKVTYFDTVNFKKKPIRSMISLIRKSKKNMNIVLLLGVNAGSILIPFLSKIKKIKKFNMYLSMVGGGLIYDRKKEKKIIKYFNGIDSVYFETQYMTQYYAEKFDNIFYAPVFTNRNLTISPRINETSSVIKFCTYSRVSKEKGISIAIDSIKEINKRANKIVCTLDIIGEPYLDYVEEFNEKLLGTEEYINRLPYLYGDDVLNKLSSYDAMVFPTYYDGEGFPISIVECYKAGVPVIASDWHFNSEVVEHNITGIIFDLKNDYSIIESLESIINDKDKLVKLKNGAYEKSKYFEPRRVLEVLFERIKRNMYK